MRLITIGCEYVGKTTLADALQAWGAENGREFHMDDSDFSIPDDRHFEEDEQMALLQAPPGLKERFQRMQIYYHIFVQSNCEDCIFGGYHIQEAIYGPRYYYPGTEVHYLKQVEGFLQPDTILVLMTADPDRDQGQDEGGAAQVPHRASRGRGGDPGRVREGVHRVDHQAQSAAGYDRLPARGDTGPVPRRGQARPEHEGPAAPVVTCQTRL